MEYSSKGVGNAGLTTGIIGTALGVLNSGGLGGILGGVAGDNAYISRYEMAQEQKIGALEAKNALLESTVYTKDQLNDFRNYVDHKFDRVDNELRNIAVYQATNTGTLSCLAGQVAQLQALTKTIVPIDNVCPQPMPQYNSWTAPTA